jgi:multidrug efflux pump subunit AcrB
LTARSTAQVSPNFWVNPTNRVNYRVAVQTPDYAIHSVDMLLNTPIVKGQASTEALRAQGATGARGSPAQLLGNLADLGRGIEAANINHYNVQPVFDIFANVQGRDFGAVSADVQKILDAAQAELPRGSLIVMRGRVESMNSSFLGLATGLGFAVLLVYLLMVVKFQSWLDPFIILTATS